MMPVAMVMSLYRKHTGHESVTVVKTPDDLDVAASRRGRSLFLHVVNTSRTQAIPAVFSVQRQRIKRGRVYWFGLEPEQEVIEYRPEHTFPQEYVLDASWQWRFPAASVSAVELELDPA